MGIGDAYFIVQAFQELSRLSGRRHIGFCNNLIRKPPVTPVLHKSDF